MFDREAYEKRVKWFVHDRFGMFVHWELYAIPARGEWARSTERINKEDYQQYFEEFNPVDYDPKLWAQLAKEAGMYNEVGRPVVWEACITMNNNRGYHSRDTFFKPAHMLIKKLVECVSKGGNMLLNVGPDAKGNIPEESVAILHSIGKWMRRNSESIYGCDISSLEKPDYGPITKNGNKLYYHVLDNPIGFIPLYGIQKEQVKKIRLLHTGAELHIINNWICNNYKDIVFVSFGNNPVMPEETDTVIKVELH